MMKMSRRTFLKGSAGTLAAIALSAGTGASINAFEASAASEEAVWKNSFCAFCHFPGCATKVKVVNGVAVEIMGDKNSETNQGRLCLRGMSTLNNLYNPYRVKAPMKRTNPEKGLDIDPGWVEITWEEALDIVASKLKAAMDEDPRSILISGGFGVEESFRVAPAQAVFGTPNYLTSPGTLCPEHFNQLHLNGQMLDRIDLEYVDYIVEIGRTMGSDWCATSANHSSHYADALERGAKFVTVNPYCTHSAQRGEWVPIMPGTDTALGFALLYTIIHEIGVYDEHFMKVRSNAPYLVDPSFEMIKGRKVYKQGYIRNADGKPLVWDEVLNQAVPFDSSMGESYALLGTYEVEGKTVTTSFQVLKDYVKEYTPEWAEPITTIPAAKVREIARDLVSHARIGSTINIEGFEFPYRPSCIFMGRGMASHMLGVEAAKALGTVNLLLGNLDVPGGIQGTANANWYTLNADQDGILEARGIMANQVTGEDIVYPPATVDMGGFYPMRHAAIPLAWKTINDPEKYHIGYPINVMMVHGADPLGSGATCQEVIEALKKIPFTFSVAYHYDLPTQFADILLAESSLLEKDALYRVFRNEKEVTHQTRGLMGTMVRRPAVDNVYNTRIPEDILADLAERLGRLPAFSGACNDNGPRSLFSAVSPTMAAGLTPEYALEPNKKYTWREFIDRKISSDFGPEAIAEFDKCAFKPFRLPLKETYNYYYVPDNAIRLPVYYERMVRNGEKMMQQLKEFNVTVPNQDMDHIYSHYSGMPVWYDNAGFETTEEYPFKAVNWKVHYGVNNTGGLYENAYVQEIIDHSNSYVKCVWVPASAAADLGIQEGDTVVVESRFGKTQGKAHLSQFMHPKCIGIPGNFGRRTGYMNPLKNTGVHFNSLLTVDESTLNPISLSLESSPQIKVYKI
ncbi:MAG: hypothetical protein APF84_14445 [Gracilibacter sp. BRH_c7a]|nr:MAG: hypothetical protein APF84_14445 [Gracilibacter sp. BRH_c7a]